MTSAAQRDADVPGTPVVPAPEPPDSTDAWYAPSVRAQYEVTPGVVTTIHDGPDGVGFTYQIREPALGADSERALVSVLSIFRAWQVHKPLPPTPS